MKTAQELLNERSTRIKKAIALEKPDRTPVVLSADAFCANLMGVKMSEFCADIKLTNKAMLDTLKTLGEVDGMNSSFAFLPIFPLEIIT